MQDILINWAPQETRVAVVENGAVQELHVERTLERGLVGNIYLGKVARVLPGMQSAFIDIGLERAAFLHVADLHGGRRRRTARARRRACTAGADRAPGVRRPDADGAGHQGPDRHQGRAAVDAGQHRRAHAGFLPQDNHIGISQKIGSHRAARAAARAHAGAGRRAGRRQGGGFILRTNAEEASDAELADDIAYLRKTWAAIRERAHGDAARHAAAPGPEPGRARAARPGQRRRRRRSASTRKLQFDTLQAFGATFMPGAVAKLEHYQRRAADLRPVQHRRGDRARAGAPGRPEVRRLPDHRPDRGADDGRRQHRRLRRRAQLRRHDLQDQPRGGRRHRAPAAPAQPGRHHHRRLHRHDARGPPGRRCWPSSASSWRATARAPRSAASRSWAWSR